MKKIGELLDHIKECPIGWFGDRLLMHRSATETDARAWLQKLHELSEAAGGPPNHIIRIPRPGATEDHR